MACQIVKTTVDGIEYTTIQFPARHGLAIKGRLIKIVGPALGGLSLSSVQGSNIDLAAVIAQLDPDAFIKLTLDLLAYTKRAGKSIDEASFDLDFAGDYMHLYKVLWHVIQANSFFGKGDIGKMIGSLMTKTPTVSPSDLTPTSQAS
jgi:hypothetical protein